jgi:acyl carrier protein
MSAAQTTSDRIKDFVLAKFPLARRRGIKESEPLLDAGILDSMGVLELVGFVEQEFAIRVSDDELVPENFESIERIAGFVSRKQSEDVHPNRVGIG